MRRRTGHGFKDIKLAILPGNAWTKHFATVRFTASRLLQGGFSIHGGLVSFKSSRALSSVESEAAHVRRHVLRARPPASYWRFFVFIHHSRTGPIMRARLTAIIARRPR